ncbi:hypothetical protein FKM82_026711 [Ascaphus truei]
MLNSHLQNVESLNYTLGGEEVEREESYNAWSVICPSAVHTALRLRTRCGQRRAQPRATRPFPPVWRSPLAASDLADCVL